MPARQHAVGGIFLARYPVGQTCSDSSAILLPFAVRSGGTKEEAGIKHLRNVAMLALLAAGILLGTNTATRAGETALALKGYDPVAYFTDKRPMVGDPQYQYEWDGAVYRFASAEHLALFKSDPDRYLPQCKNWCAPSVATGVNVVGNPDW